MMAIEIVGGVYCPLSPHDPQYRLDELVEETGTHLVLVHSLTKGKFTNNIISSNIDQVLINHNVESYIDVDQLSNVLTADDNIAYVIFTSGSTGLPKAVSRIESSFFIDIITFLYCRLKFDIETLSNAYIQ